MSLLVTWHLVATSLVLGQVDHVSLALTGPGATSPLEGCAVQVLRVQVEDATNFPVSTPSQVSVCAPVEAGLVFGPSTLGGEARTETCVSGTLAGDGSGLLEVTPTFPVLVTIGAASPDAPGGDALLLVEWIPGPPSPTATTLAPRDGPGPLSMRVGAIGWVRLVPRDECGFSATSRASEVVISFPRELAVGAQQSDLDSGVIDFPFQLSECPARAAPITIQAVAGARPLVDDAGVERTITIVPTCDPRVNEVSCDCGAGPGAGQTAVALAVAALTLRERWRTAAARRRARPRSAAGP